MNLNYSHICERATFIFFTLLLYGKVIFGNIVNSSKDVKNENIKGLTELMKWNNNKFKSNIDMIIECFVKK
jgi:hypothetical protein